MYNISATLLSAVKPLKVKNSLVGRLRPGKLHRHDFSVVVPTVWEPNRFRHPDGIGSRRVLCSNHLWPLRNHHSAGWCSGCIHVGLQMVRAAGHQSLPPLESIRWSLNDTLQWGGQRPSLSHCYAIPSWLLYSANTARIQRSRGRHHLQKSHRCRHCKQPGAECRRRRRRGLPLGRAPSPLDSRRGHSSPRRGQEPTKTQPIGIWMYGVLLGSGFLGIILHN